MLQVTNYKTQEKGFTLIEIIMAVFFIAVGMGGVFTVVQKSFAIMSLSESRIVAANLAQEGIEVVRNIRDTNWLEGEQYDQGIGAVYSPPATPTISYEVDYDDGEADIMVCDPCDYSNMKFLKINSSGFYNYTNGDDAKFKRRVVISDKTVNSMKITVDVIWKERGGQEHTFTAQSALYDWKTH